MPTAWLKAWLRFGALTFMIIVNVCVNPFVGTLRFSDTEILNLTALLFLQYTGTGNTRKRLLLEFNLKSVHQGLYSLKFWYIRRLNFS